MNPITKALRLPLLLLGALLPFPAALLPAAVHVLEHGSLRVEIETGTDRHMAEFGPRFDRTAVVRSVRVDGQERLGRWGLCDEFGLYGDGVLRHEEAQPGDAIIKIGVGLLTRNTAESYQFSHPYPVRELFPLTVQEEGNQLAVNQESTGPLPHRYRYVKVYGISGDNVLTIRYTLTNTGETAWSFEHYNHHWFQLEGEPVGPAYTCATGFATPQEGLRLTADGGALKLAMPLGPGEAGYLAGDLQGIGADQNTFTVSVGGRPLVTYRGCFAPTRFALYAAEDGFCPELFMRARLEPGESLSWKAQYRFAAPPDESARGASGNTNGAGF